MKSKHSPPQRLQPLSLKNITNLFILGFLLLSIQCVNAIKFDLPASKDPIEKCIWDYATHDTLVIISINVGRSATDGSEASRNNQRIDVEVVDGSDHQNIYQVKKDLHGETRIAVTTHAEADVGVCFKNWANSNVQDSRIQSLATSIDLDVDIGANAVDYNSIALKENLSGFEVEMRRLETQMKEIVDGLNYLRKREVRFRDTNESTNDRVKNFSLFSIFALLCLGVWQILYLRNFFKSNKLV